MILTNRAFREIAWKFVAGEDLDTGLQAVGRLNSRGIQGLLNYVGQHVLDAEEATARTDSTIDCVKRIAAQRLNSHISVKLTNVGLDVSDNLCYQNLRKILACASASGVFVWIDMEEYPYLARTLRLCDDMRDQNGPTSIGIVVQSYLRLNNPLVDLLRRGWRVRLVKGGYWEPGEVVYRKQKEIDQAFASDIEIALSSGGCPAVATHDSLFIALVKRLAAAKSLKPHDFEFQMLYGVRNDLQAQLVNEGYTVRSYVPYGADWHSYVIGCVRRAFADTLGLPAMIRF
jgi:proline dehydrogenase